ncbi:Ankyrin repeat-containing protein [Brazilian cedratvirus IHUMI]|uniref:Ankyrin repeat-containing protein n=1 Tax=Brazilian cedratvirus IHUMI TaxID=2126980 RepID=A0A2R8FFB6_9VIRU|nr:Ankyrin repeat-containing protein [Brazilian cedratvirus IHUMI]
MQAVLETIFSYSRGYNYPHRQVCSEFRTLAPKTDLLTYLDGLCREHGNKFHQVCNINLEDILNYIGHKNANICTSLAETGHKKLFKWAIALGYVPDEDTLERAIEFGNLEIATCIYKGGWIRIEFWTYGYVCDLAAEHGRLEILKWAREIDSERDATVLYNSAEQGHLEILKWALENGYEMYVDVFYTAAEKGQFAILKWLVENFPSFWDEGVLHAAIQTRQVEIIKYIINNNL